MILFKRSCTFLLLIVDEIDSGIKNDIRYDFVPNFVQLYSSDLS